MNIPIGWSIAIISCLAGFVVLGGQVSQLWIPAEYLIILGAALGALVAGNKGRNLKNIVSAIQKLFVPASVNKKANVTERERKKEGREKLSDSVEADLLE